MTFALRDRPLDRNKAKAAAVRIANAYLRGVKESEMEPGTEGEDPEQRIRSFVDGAMLVYTIYEASGSPTRPDPKDNSTFAAAFNAWLMEVWWEWEQHAVN